jgi:hypothetical protein
MVNVLILCREGRDSYGGIPNRNVTYSKVNQAAERGLHVVT